MTRSVFTKRSERLRALLADARRQAGLTQADLAVRLGRPQSYVSKYESGERRIDLIEVMEVVEAIGADVIAIIRQLHQDGGSDAD